MEHRCSECQTSYSTLSNLRKHVRKFHSNDISKLAPFRYKKSSPNSHIRCNLCEKTFNHRQSLRKHKIKVHGVESLPQKKTIKHAKKCPLCPYGASLIKDFINHFQNVHEITLRWHNLTFSSTEDFSMWKKNNEAKSYSKFIKTKMGSCQSHTTIQYTCHRSGNYYPEGKGIRRLKTQGSNKINAYCPANIKLIIGNDSTLKVKYLETHVGHKHDVDHLQSIKLNKRKKRDKNLAVGNPDSNTTQVSRKPKMEHSIEERQTNILIQFQDIVASADSHEKLDAIDKIFTCLPPVLDAIDNNNKNSYTFPISQKNDVHEEKIQWRLVQEQGIEAPPPLKFWRSKDT